MANFLILEDTGILSVSDAHSFITKTGYQQKVLVHHDNLGNIVISWVNLVLDFGSWGKESVTEAKIFKVDESGEPDFSQCLCETKTIAEALEALKTM